jgi:colanic acid biosynthesis glycosyl transferase WcaI
MRVLILSQYYTPEPIPKPAELAASLSEAGDAVTVITGCPNYPSGKLYAGHSLPVLRRENVGGIRVIRTFELPYHGRSAIGRIANYVSFMLSAPWGCLLAPKFDVIYVWHPPLTVGLAAWVIARLRGVPFVYDVQDIWPEAAVLAGVLKEGGVVRFLARVEKFVYRRAAHLITVTEGARQNLIGKGVEPTRVTALPHWFTPSTLATTGGEARDKVRASYGWSEKFVFLFAGNLGMVQGLDVIIHAAAQIRGDARIHVVFVGDGADRARLQALVRTLQLGPQVQFVDRQPVERMGEFYGAADALLVHLKWSELSAYVIPSKTLAYLASGKPIVMAMHGAAADLVRAAEAGLVVPPDAPAELAAAMQAMVALPPERRERMGACGREFLHRHLSRDVVAPRYRELLQAAARRRAS